MKYLKPLKMPRNVLKKSNPIHKVQPLVFLQVDRQTRKSWAVGQSEDQKLKTDNGDFVVAFAPKSSLLKSIWSNTCGHTLTRCHSLVTFASVDLNRLAISGHICLYIPVRNHIIAKHVVGDLPPAPI